ncbi:MAG: DUF6142 family protein [Lachnospiraceae bacterium]
MAKRYKYTFARQKEAAQGIVSSAIAGMSFLLFIVVVILSFAFQQKAEIAIGALSLFAMLSAVYGFVQGLKSFSKKEEGHLFSIIGSLSNGVIMIGWLGLYLTGVSI